MIEEMGMSMKFWPLTDRSQVWVPQSVYEVHIKERGYCNECCKGLSSPYRSPPSSWVTGVCQTPDWWECHTQGRLYTTNGDFNQSAEAGDLTPDPLNRKAHLLRFIHLATALCEKPLKKWHLDFASPWGDYSTFLCLSLSFLIVNPLILQNTFWSYKILVSFRQYHFLTGIACQGEPLIEKCIL